MFPSDDPFAYPNQPMMELGYQHGKRPIGSAVMQHPDSQFFMEGAFDDLDGQLLGQVPPYLVHEHSQRGMEVNPQPYGSPSIIGLGGSIHRGPPQGRRVQIRQHDRQVEQLLAQQGYQQDWGSIFGRGNFSGL
jgi:hypothetical protein